MHSYRYYGTIPRTYSPPARPSFFRDNILIIACACLLSLGAFCSVFFIYNSAVSISKSVQPDRYRQLQFPPVDETPTIERRMNTTASKGWGPEKAKNFAGYVTVNLSHFFYWFFESRDQPLHDPLILWMTGGPGCSGLFALFNENGPYKINQNLSLEINPFSWTQRANVIWIDQPVGTGFSYSDDPEDNLIFTQQRVAEYLYQFLQVFFQSYPEYSKLPLYISGESYAGHYVPALAQYILEQNEKVKEINGLKDMWKGHNEANRSIVLQLEGVTIGDGMVDPLVQFASTPDYAHDYLSDVLTSEELDDMKNKLPTCLDQIQHCSQNSSEGLQSCVSAFEVCNDFQLTSFIKHGLNPYDLRKKCIGSEPFCYNFSLITQFLKQQRVQHTLGVFGREWQFCNLNVTLNFVMGGDYMLSYASLIPLLLEHNVRVLVYNGDSDYYVNWYGSLAWVRKMEWSGRSSFLQAPVTEWLVVDGHMRTMPLTTHSPSTKNATGTPSKLENDISGWIQNAEGLTFARVRGAGHLVPMDQPAASLALINAVIHHAPLVVLSYLS